MICHQCNQNSIKIHNEPDGRDIGEPAVYIKCDICGLYIRGEDSELLCNLFMYNENLEEAEKLGKESIIEGKLLTDNPYSLDSNQIILNKRWELGYNREKESYEYSALSLSAKKIETELRAEIKRLEIHKEKTEVQIDTFIYDNYKRIDKFCSKLLKRKILGKILSKGILSFKKEYDEFYRSNWDYPEIPGK